jgi:DinB family protein
VHTTAAIRRQLDEITAVVDRDESQLLSRKAEVSKWSPAEHLDHSLRVASAVLKRLLSPAAPLPQGINMLGRAVLFAGWFPRGRGESPENLRGAPATRQELHAAIEEVQRLINGAEQDDRPMERRPIVRHPFFGGLNAAQAMRFLVVHNNHHLKIIRDIIAR